MPWVQPKEEWEVTDVFTLDDWRRVVENAKYLYQLVGATFTWRDCDLADTMALPYYDVVNALEANLNDLCNDAAYNSVGFEATEWFARTSKQWTHNPSASDFSRWERLEAQLYYWHYIYVTQTNVLVSGTFYANNNRIVQTFSRGR